MFRSPQKLRSGLKGKPVLLSGADKSNVQRSLSAPSPITSSSGNSATTMSASNNPNVDAALLAAIQVVVEKAVKTAVEAALSSFKDTINKLQDDVSSLQRKIKDMDEGLVERTDELEQYQRRNNIRLFGIKETAGEDTDKLVIQMCQDKLGISLQADAVSRSHRVGKQQEVGADGKIRHRPIIIQFATYRTRRMVFGAKKQLKATGITIREDLTRRRQELYRRAVSRYGIKNVWTQDGRVLWVDNGKKGMATRLADLPVQ